MRRVLASSPWEFLWISLVIVRTRRPLRAVGSTLGLGWVWRSEVRRAANGAPVWLRVRRNGDRVDPRVESPGGERLVAPLPLSDGDEIRVGPVLVKFRRLDPGGSTATQRSG